MRYLKPRGCIESNPQAHSIKLGGVYISLTQISKSQGLDLSEVSRIISGKKSPSFQYISKIAKALEIGIDDVLYWIQVKKVA